MRIALLTYSTKPRGGVVHTLALAEALRPAGRGRDGLDPGQGRRRRASSVRSTRPSPCGWCRSHTSTTRPSVSGSSDRSRRCAPPSTGGLRHRPRAGLHQCQRGRAVRANHPPPRPVHDAGAGRLPRARDRGSVRADLRVRCGRRGGLGRVGVRLPTVIPNGVDVADSRMQPGMIWNPLLRGNNGAPDSGSMCWRWVGSNPGRGASICWRPMP